MCRKALYEFDLVPADGKIALALSGGKDSLTLLHLLKKISGRGFPELDLYGIHVAGEFSCGAGVNENFLRKVCESLGVPLIVRQSTQKLETLECYRCSRERRRLIFEAAKEVGAITVAFGHHRDDSVETLVMNLLHKAEFAANLPKVPMHDFGVTIIRPMIFISEDQIREFAKENGFARITCQCPVGQVSLRRKMKELLLHIEETFPNARENLAQAGLTYGSDKALRR
jgi:tRNA 2-thiocytidine biosynthesis protein TtcA